MPPSFVPLNRLRHAGKYLLASDRYPNAAGQPVAALVGAELARAAVCLPLAFIPDSPAPDAPLLLAAVLGLKPGENLFVAPDGRWLGTYVPAVFRRHPFSLIRTTAEDETELLTVAVDENAGRLGDGPAGLPLFDEHGDLSAHMQTVVDFLRQMESNAARTAAACAHLKAHDLLVPWALTVQTAEGTARTVSGLFQVDEARLNALPDAAFLELRHSGALVLAQLHLVSMQHVSVLSQLDHLQVQLAAAERAKPRLDDMLDLGRGDEIMFTF